MKATFSKLVALVGAGNMAEALARGWLSAGLFRPCDMVASDPAEGRRVRFQEELKIRVESDAREAVRGAGLIVLAVKPHVLPEVLPLLHDAISPGASVISIAAGVTTRKIERWLGGEPRVIRAMPNTPALVGAGITAICEGRHAREEDMAVAERLLGAVGRVLRVDEAAMDAVTAISGSGPAYVFYLVESWMRAAERLGISPQIARHLIVDTVAGAARLLSETGLSASELRRRVTSKGGTTEAAVHVLDTHRFSAVFEEAVHAAADRACELAKEEIVRLESADEK